MRALSWEMQRHLIINRILKRFIRKKQRIIKMKIVVLHLFQSRQEKRIQLLISGISERMNKTHMIDVLLLTPSEQLSTPG